MNNKEDIKDKLISVKGILNISKNEDKKQCIKINIMKQSDDVEFKNLGVYMSTDDSFYGHLGFQEQASLENLERVFDNGIFQEMSKVKTNENTNNELMHDVTEKCTKYKLTNDDIIIREIVRICKQLYSVYTKFNIQPKGFDINIESANTNNSLHYNSNFEALNNIEIEVTKLEELRVQLVDKTDIIIDGSRIQVTIDGTSKNLERQFKINGLDIENSSYTVPKGDSLITDKLSVMLFKTIVSKSKSCEIYINNMRGFLRDIKITNINELILYKLKENGRYTINNNEATIEEQDLSKILNQFKPCKIVVNAECGENEIIINKAIEDLNYLKRYAYNNKIELTITNEPSLKSIRVWDMYNIAMYSIEKLDEIVKAASKIGGFWGKESWNDFMDGTYRTDGWYVHLNNYEQALANKLANVQVMYVNNGSEVGADNVDVDSVIDYYANIEDYLDNVINQFDCELRNCDSADTDEDYIEFISSTLDKLNVKLEKIRNAKRKLKQEK